MIDARVAVSRLWMIRQQNTLVFLFIEISQYNHNMYTQHIKNQYYSFLPQKSTLNNSHHSLLFLPSPHPHRINNPLNFLAATSNSLSPNFKSKLCNLNLLTTPQKCLTTKEIEMQAIDSSAYLGQAKRTTMPLHRADSLATSQRILPASPQHPTRTKIKFTYQTKMDGAKRMQFKNSCENSSVLSFKQKLQQPFGQSKNKAHRIYKNKLSSSVFSQFYQPIRSARSTPLSSLTSLHVSAIKEQRQQCQPVTSIKSKGEELQQLLLELKREADLLSSKIIRNREFSMCKTSAAETSTSAMTGIKQSQMSVDSSRWSSTQSNSKCNFQANHHFLRPSLADKIPTSKHLGQTIFLSPNTYDFGGIMLQNDEQPREYEKNEGQTTVGYGLMRDWDQLKGLLNHDNQQTMKESIHCGPDVRANDFNLEMLQKFGREIKESTVGFQE